MSKLGTYMQMFGAFVYHGPWDDKYIDLNHDKKWFHKYVFRKHTRRRQKRKKSR